VQGAARVAQHYTESPKPNHPKALAVLGAAPLAEHETESRNLT